MRSGFWSLLGAAAVCIGCGGSSDTGLFTRGSQGAVGGAGGRGEASGGVGGTGGRSAGSGGEGGSSVTGTGGTAVTGGYGGTAGGGVLGSGGFPEPPDAGASGGAASSELPFGGIVPQECSTCAHKFCPTQVAACGAEAECLAVEHCLTTCAFVDCAGCALAAPPAFSALFSGCLTQACPACPTITAH